MVPPQVRLDTGVWALVDTCNDPIIGMALGSFWHHQASLELESIPRREILVDL